MKRFIHFDAIVDNRMVATSVRADRITAIVNTFDAGVAVIYMEDVQGGTYVKVDATDPRAHLVSMVEMAQDEPAGDGA